MLNIEVVRFEAQDVITASVAAPAVPMIPLQPATPRCDCDKNGCTIQAGFHTYHDANGTGPLVCQGNHTCGN